MGDALEVERLLSAYVRLGEERDALGLLGSRRRSNKLFDQMHVMVKQLRETEEGRRALATLLSHPNETVRSSAAVNSLDWAPEDAVPVLELIARDSDQPFQRMNARQSLIEFRAGRLQLDW